MKFQQLLFIATLSCHALAFAVHPTKLCAQVVHSDINFSYSGGQIVVDTGATSGVATGDFPVDGFFSQFETNPGFASEGDVGFGINPNDTIAYNVLDNLLLWDGSNFVTPAANTQIRIENNGSAADTVIHSSSGTQPGAFGPLANGVGQADGNGDFHSHVSFFLEPNNGSPSPDFGVYGLKFSLSTNAAGIADSDPFFAVFNFGLSEQMFADAIQQYASLLVPSIDGDFNNDGNVDGQDFLAWQRGEVTNPPNNADLLAWINNYGTSSTLLASSITAVPEPTTGVLVLISSVWGLLTCRRFHRPVPFAARAQTI